MNETRPEPMWKVWNYNVDLETIRFKECLKKFPIIAFDTEYPGTIHKTSMDSSPDEFYTVMKANVESTKLIQCGFTLFNAQGEIGGTWEINFSNFGDPTDTRNEISIDFLRSHGLDLERIRNQGVDMFGYGFFPKLLTVFRSQKHVSFVTFQGAYDFAYFLSILNYGKLPETLREFASEIGKVFGEVYDLKVMARVCHGLGEHLGLSKLAHLLKIARVGRAHHAGSDSLLTALVFIKLMKVYEDAKLAKAVLYGIGKITITTVSELQQPSSGSIQLMSQQNLVSYPSSNLLYPNGYVPNYEHPPFYYLDPSGVPCVPWTIYNGRYVNQLNQLNPSSTFAYPSQTTYAAADYLGPVPNYYNNNTCYVVD